jgi:hypothetical protein
VAVSWPCRRRSIGWDQATNRAAGNKIATPAAVKSKNLEALQMSVRGTFQT